MPNTKAKKESLKSAPGPSKTVDVLKEKKKKSSELMSKLKAKAKTPEQIRKARTKLRQADFKSKERITSKARKAAGKFTEKVKKLNLKEKIHKHRKILMAGAGILALAGAWYMTRKSSAVKKWGLRSVAVGIAGYFGFKIFGDKEKKDGDSQKKGDGGRLIIREKKDDGHAGVIKKKPVKTKKASELIKENKEKDKRAVALYAKAKKIIMAIKSGKRKWTKEHGIFMQQAIDALKAVKRPGKGKLNVAYNKALEAKIAELNPYVNNPEKTTKRKVVEFFVGDVGGVAMKYITIAPLAFMTEGLLRKLLREKAVAKSIRLAVAQGKVGKIDQVIKYAMLLRKRKECEELIKLSNMVGKNHPLLRHQLEGMKELGIKSVRQAEKFIKEVGTNRKMAWAGLNQGREIFFRAQLLDSILSPKMLKVMQTHAKEMEQIMKTFKEGARGEKRLMNFLQYINKAEHGAESLKVMAQHSDEIVKLITRHGPEFAEALAHHPKHAKHLIKAMEKMHYGKSIKMHARSWDHVMKGMVKELDAATRAGEKAVMVAAEKSGFKLGEKVVADAVAELAAEAGEKAAARAAEKMAAKSAPEAFAKHAARLKVMRAAGIVFELAIAMLDFIEADQIDKMVKNIEKFGNSKRADVLKAKATMKRIMGTAEAAAGIALLFVQPHFAVVGAVLGIQMLARSVGEGIIIAKERRTRSPQAWAAERTHENLVKLWCTNHGLSDGDWLGSKLGASENQKKLRKGNKDTRRNMLLGILIRQKGITTMKGGKLIMDQLDKKFKGERSEVAKLISHQLDFIAAHKPAFDPEDPIKANRLLAQSEVYANLKMEHTRIKSVMKWAKKAKRGISGKTAQEKGLDFQFAQYADDMRWKGEKVSDKAKLIDSFLKSYHPDANAEQMKLYEGLRPGNIKKMKEAVEKKALGSAEKFFDPKAKHVTPHERKLYGGLLKIAPLSGSVFGETTASEVMALHQRRSFEGKMNILHTLLMQHQESARAGAGGLDHYVELNHAYTFCLKYYQAVYGVPYKPSAATLGVSEIRIYQWIKSLSTERSEGISFSSTKEKDMKPIRKMAMSDADIERNFSVSRKKEMIAMYALGHALGYRGPIHLVRSFFTEAKKDSLGIYHDGKEWVINDSGISFDDGHSKWAKQKLIASKMLVWNNNEFVYSLEARLKRKKDKNFDLLCRTYEKKVNAWEDNPLAVDFLIEYCTKWKQDMLEREDDKWYVPNDDDSDAAIGRVGLSYSKLLKKQKELFKDYDSPEARKKFQAKLLDYLKKKDAKGESYTVLPPDMLKEAYLTGISNSGLFAYKLVDGKIHAWKIGFMTDDKMPAFIHKVDNQKEMKKYEFSASLLQAMEDVESEKKAHKAVLDVCGEELSAQLDKLDKLNPAVKAALKRAISGTIADFQELDAVVYNPKFEITKNHKRQFAKRMRATIVRMSQLVFQLRGVKDEAKLKKIFQLRRNVSKVKQLYLISFFHKSRSTETTLFWTSRKDQVSSADDVQKIEADMEQGLSKFATGNLHTRSKEVQEFYRKEKTELLSRMGAMKNSPAKRYYTQYYLRQSAQLIYQAHVYGLNDAAELNEEPEFEDKFESKKDLEKLEKFMNANRLSFKDWLLYHYGKSPEEAEKISTYDVAGHRKSILALVKQKESKAEATKNSATAATAQAESMMSMCLAYRDILAQLKVQGVVLKSGALKEMEKVYATLNGPQFLKGGLDKMGYSTAFSGNFSEMRDKGWGVVIGHFAHRMRAFYKLRSESMSRGLKELWDYMSIKKEVRETLHMSLGDPEERTLFQMKRVILLSKKLKENPSLAFIANREGNSFKLWSLGQTNISQRYKKYFARSTADRKYSAGVYAKYDMPVIRSIEGELSHYENALAQLKGQKGYQEANKAFRVAQQDLAGTRDKDPLRVEDIQSALKSIEMFEMRFKSLLDEMGVNGYWEKGSGSRKESKVAHDKEAKGGKVTLFKLTHKDPKVMKMIETTSKMKLGQEARKRETPFAKIVKKIAAERALIAKLDAESARNARIINDYEASQRAFAQTRMYRKAVGVDKNGKKIYKWAFRGKENRKKVDVYALHERNAEIYKQTSVIQARIDKLLIQRDKLDPLKKLEKRKRPESLRQKQRREGLERASLGSVRILKKGDEGFKANSVRASYIDKKGKKRIIELERYGDKITEVIITKKLVARPVMTKEEEYEDEDGETAYRDVKISYASRYDKDEKAAAKEAKAKGKPYMSQEEAEATGLISWDEKSKSWKLKKGYEWADPDHDDNFALVKVEEYQEKMDLGDSPAAALPKYLKSQKPAIKRLLAPFNIQGMWTGPAWGDMLERNIVSLQQDVNNAGMEINVADYIQSKWKTFAKGKDEKKLLAQLARNPKSIFDAMRKADLSEQKESVESRRLKRTKRNFGHQLDIVMNWTKMMDKQNPLYKRVFIQRLRSIKRKVLAQKTVKSCNQTFDDLMLDFKADWKQGKLGPKGVSFRELWPNHENLSSYLGWMIDRSEDISAQRNIRKLALLKEVPKEKLAIAKLNFSLEIDRLLRFTNEIDTSKKENKAFISTYEKGLESVRSEITKLPKGATAEKCAALFKEKMTAFYNGVIVGNGGKWRKERVVKGKTIQDDRYYKNIVESNLVYAIRNGKEIAGRDPSENE